jgi:cytochrome c553
MPTQGIFALGGSHIGEKLREAGIDPIMKTLATRLSKQDIENLAVFYASLN